MDIKSPQTFEVTEYTMYIINKGAVLTSATMPWHRLIFLPQKFASKVCLQKKKNYKQIFSTIKMSHFSGSTWSKSLEAALIGALGHLICSYFLQALLWQKTQILYEIKSQILSKTKINKVEPKHLYLYNKIT